MDARIAKFMHTHVFLSLNPIKFKHMFITITSLGFHKIRHEYAKQVNAWHDKDNMCSFVNSMEVQQN